MDFCDLTTVSEFILIRLSNSQLCYPLFVFFALIYQVTLVGNCTILLVIGTEKKLHTPMYCFLANLSLLDMFCPSASVPKMLQKLLTQKESISFVGSALQLYFLVALAGTEVFLLAVIAYDRYVAICFPLHYTRIMSKMHCAQLIPGTWAMGFLNSLLYTVLTFRLSFCKSNQVNQYYYDIPPVVALFCSSTYLVEMFVSVEGGALGTSAFMITFISDIYIISTILKIQSSEGKCKAFSTCPSHLIVDSLFCGTVLFNSMCPSSSQHYPGRNKLISMHYGLITPMLKPIIYSLRNTEGKETLRKILYDKTCLQLS